MDSETLTLLLQSRHLNMEERRARGLWPHGPLRYQDVLDHLAGLISARQWFPYEIPKSRPFWDFTIIERLGIDDFAVHVHHAGPLGDQRDVVLRRFGSAREAADFFLKEELRLPGDLDGWKVVK